MNKEVAMEEVDLPIIDVLEYALDKDLKAKCPKFMTIVEDFDYSAKGLIVATVGSEAPIRSNILSIQEYQDILANAVDYLLDCISRTSEFKDKDLFTTGYSLRYSKTKKKNKVLLQIKIAFKK